MHTSRVFRRCLVPASAGLIAASMVVTVHGRDDLHIFHPVPTANPANPPAPAVQPNRIADNFALSLIAQGTDPIENLYARIGTNALIVFPPAGSLSISISRASRSTSGQP